MSLPLKWPPLVSSHAPCYPNCGAMAPKDRNGMHCNPKPPCPNAEDGMAYGFGSNNYGESTIPQALLGPLPMPVYGMAAAAYGVGAVYVMQWVAHCACMAVPSVWSAAVGCGMWCAMACHSLLRCRWDLSDGSVGVVFLCSVGCGWHMACMLAAVLNFCAVQCGADIWWHMVWPACTPKTPSYIQWLAKPPFWDHQHSS